MEIPARATDANGLSNNTLKVTSLDLSRSNVSGGRCDFIFTWNDPSGTENLSYAIEVFDNTGPVSAPVLIGKSATIPDVENGTEFSVKITASNTSGVYSITIIDDVVKRSET